MKKYWKRAAPGAVGSATGVCIAAGLLRHPEELLDIPSFFANWILCFAVTFAVFSLILWLLDKRKR